MTYHIPSVQNMKSSNGNYVPNQFIITEDTKTIFQSYDSIIALIDFTEKIITIYPDYNYSQTTVKYRNQFFSDYGLEGLATIKGLEKALSEWHYNEYAVIKADR